MGILRVCYKSGVRFDEAYYLAKHLPLAGSIMGPFGVTAVEVMKVTAAADGSTPPYQVIFSAHFATAEGLQQAMQTPRMADIIADIANYYDGMPDILIGDELALPSAP